MKKIFAIILATIMVMSLVPASVFAAITNDTGCEDYHTVKNCDYTELDFVEATCTTPSYTTYKCNKCGEQFADNFGAKANGHKWVSTANKTHKDSEGTCTTPAKKWEKCSVCGIAGENACTIEGCKGKCGFGYNEYKNKHNYEYVSGVGCTAIYKCSECDDVKTDAHDWKFTKVTVEPKWEAGNYIAGEALFTCKECNDTKTVQILDVACKHKTKSLVKAAVAATCTEDGSYAIYRCDDCHQLYILVEDDYVEIDKMDSKDVVIPSKGGHVAKDGTTKTVGCKLTYTCKNCKETVEEDAHPENLIETQGSTPATCTTYGYTYKLCKACGVSFVETHKPTGHNTVTKTVDATCAKAGTVYTLCCNANCTSVLTAPADVVVTKDGKVYNKIVKTEAVGTNGEHTPFVLYNGKKYTNEKSLIDNVNYFDAKDLPNATCDMGVVYVWQCANGCNTYYDVDQRDPAGHKMELTVESHNCGKATKTLPAWTTRIATKCSACGETVNSDFVNANSQVMFESKAEAEVFHGIAFKNTDAKGNVTYTYRDGKSAASLGTPVSVPGNCTIPSYDIYTCPTCGTAVYVNTGIQGHVAAAGKDVAFKAPESCGKTGTLAHSVCALCNAKFVQNDDNTQTTLTSTVIAAHSYYGEIKTTNCSKVTYWECDCGKTFTDKTATTSYTVPADAHNWKDIVAGSIATCNKAGVANVKYCVACKKLEVNRNYQNTKTGEIETIKLAADNAVFEGKKVTVTLTIGSEFVIEKDGTVKDDKANNNTLYVAKLEHTTPAGESTIKLIDDSTAKADHTKVGYELYNCDYCDYEYIVKYTPVTGGHVNAAGEILTTKCSNASVKDRYCVVCDTKIETKHNFKYEEDITVPATCVDEGYTYNYCVDCGKIVVTGKMGIDKNNHADQSNVTVNYAQSGYEKGKEPCAACGYKGKAAKMDKKGLEILLSYSVNGTDATNATIGSIITVTVDLGSLNGVDVWGLEFPIAYNTRVLEYVENSASFNNDLGFNTRLATEVMGTVIGVDGKETKVPAGIIKVAAQADNADITIKGTKNLMTLQFKVVAESFFPVQIAVGKEVQDINNYSYTVRAIDETKAEVETMYNDVNVVFIEIVSFFDLDNDWEITIGDAYELYKLYLFGEYNVAADANADGKVELEDIRVFYSILTGAITVDEYFNPTEGTTGSQVQPKA